MSYDMGLLRKVLLVVVIRLSLWCLLFVYGPLKEGIAGCCHSVISLAFIGCFRLLNSANVMS